MYIARMPANRRLYLICLLAAALLAAQWLGLVHRTAHAGAVPQAAAVDAAHQGGPHAEGWFDKLFGEHPQAGQDCLLLDQLAHADSLPLATPAEAPAAPTPDGLQAPRHEAVAQCASYFEARGPPAFR